MRTERRTKQHGKRWFGLYAEELLSVQHLNLWGGTRQAMRLDLNRLGPGLRNNVLFLFFFFFFAYLPANPTEEHFLSPPPPPRMISERMLWISDCVFIQTCDSLYNMVTAQFLLRLQGGLRQKTKQKKKKSGLRLFVSRCCWLFLEGWIPSQAGWSERGGPGVSLSAKSSLFF